MSGVALSTSLAEKGWHANHSTNSSGLSGWFPPSTHQLLQLHASELGWLTSYYASQSVNVSSASMPIAPPYTLLVMPHRYASSLGCVTDTWASTALSQLQNNLGLNPNDFTFKCVCVCTPAASPC